MTTPPGPTEADLRRLKIYRAQARVEVAAARKVFHDARRVAFRRELAATVRCASPFLLSLLAIEEVALGDVVTRMEPIAEWPSRLRLDLFGDSHGKTVHAFRYAVLDGSRASRRSKPVALNGVFVPLDDGGLLHVRIVAHSVEARVVTRDLVFETRFGELRITTTGVVPAAITAGAVGRLVDEVVGHPATGGRGWRVRSAESISSGTVFVIPTGSVPWTIR